jgi:hypothetical protein
MHVSGSWRMAFKDDMGLHKEDLHIKANADGDTYTQQFRKHCS